MEEKFNKIKEEIETSNHLHKKYYDNNAKIIIQRAKKYMDKIKETNPEKIKEW